MGSATVIVTAVVRCVRLVRAWPDSMPVHITDRVADTAISARSVPPVRDIMRSIMGCTECLSRDMGMDQDLDLVRDMVRELGMVLVQDRDQAGKPVGGGVPAPASSSMVRDLEQDRGE